MYVQRFLHCVRASARVGCIGTGFCDDSVLHGPTTPYTMERMTLIVPRSKSISPHFRPNISLCRNPVDAARDRKSTRLNSSHLGISYAVFCLKKKKKSKKYRVPEQKMYTR